MLNFSAQQTKIVPKIQTFRASDRKSTDEKMDQLANLLQDPDVLGNVEMLKKKLADKQSPNKLEEMFYTLRDFWNGLFYLIRSDLDTQNAASHSLSKGSL